MYRKSHYLYFQQQADLQMWDWNLWQEVEDSSGFNTVHSWIEINPEQLHLSVIVASEVFYCNTFFLSNVFFFLYFYYYLLRITELETIKKEIEN